MEKDNLRLYRVIETKKMTAEELQKVLNEATDDLREMQIDYVVGTKIILGFNSLLNAKGRSDARIKSAKISRQGNFLANAASMTN